jgi:hypothetical protein
MSSILSNEEFCHQMFPILKNDYKKIQIEILFGETTINIDCTQIPVNSYLTEYNLTVEIEPTQWSKDPKFVDMVLTKYFTFADGTTYMHLPHETDIIIIPLDLSGDWKTLARGQINKYMPTEKKKNTKAQTSTPQL